MKVVADVDRAVLVPIERQHAVPLCAEPQSSNLLLHLFLHLLPRGARPQAPKACLAGAMFRCWCHHESLRQLAHEADPDARRVASFARVVTGDESPRAVRQDEQ